MRAHPVGLERINLILHQRDQWRDNDCRARQQQGRNLVAEGLPPAGRHKDKGIPLRDYICSDLLLMGAKITIAKYSLKNFFRGLIH